MSYYRRVVKDYETIMTKDLYDNLQDGIDENKEAIGDWDSSKGSIMAQVNGMKLSYDADSKYLIIGKEEQEVEDNNTTLDTTSVITPIDAKAIFDKAEAEAKNN